MAKGGKAASIITKPIERSARRSKTVTNSAGRTIKGRRNSPVTGSHTHDFGPGGPTTVADLKAELKTMTLAKSGKQLVSSKFTKDHVFPGHANMSSSQQAQLLSKLRGNHPLSTFMPGSIDHKAQQEVLNWIDKVPDRHLHYTDGTWRIDNFGTAVPGANDYKWLTHAKDGNSVTTSGPKVPKVACAFGPDGTPVLYHFDF